MMSSGSYSSSVDMMAGAYWELDKMEIRDWSSLEHVTRVGCGSHVIAI